MRNQTLARIEKEVEAKRMAQNVEEIETLTIGQTLIALIAFSTFVFVAYCIAWFLLG